MFVEGAVDGVNINNVRFLDVNAEISPYSPYKFPGLYIFSLFLIRNLYSVGHIMRETPSFYLYLPLPAPHHGSLMYISYH